jgi:hypothetical protein
MVQHRQVQMLPLLDFPRVQIAAMWQGTPTEIVRSFLEEAEHSVRAILATAAADNATHSPLCPRIKR